jgi:hypothetical protein
MSAHKVEESQTNFAKLLLERQAAKELYQAIRLGIGALPSEAAKQSKIENPFQLIVRKNTAIELLDALALPLDFEPAPKREDDERTKEDFVVVVIGIPTATVLLNALMISLGGEPSSKSNDESVVEIVLKKFIAVDLLNALIVKLGSVPGGKGGRKKGRGKPPAPFAAEPEPLAEPPRYLNLWFTKDRTDQSRIEPTLALAGGQEVYLRVNIEAFDLRHIMSVEQAPEFPSASEIAEAFPETAGKAVPLEATVFSNDFDIPDEARTQKFDLVPGKPSKQLYFPVTPHTENTARLRLCVFYKNHLLQSLAVVAGVEKQAAVSATRQKVEVELTFSADFTNVSTVPARGLWLGINNGPDATHTLNLKDSQRALSRNLESKIETALKEAREALLKVSFNIVKDNAGNSRKEYRFDGQNYPKGVPVAEREKRLLQDLTILAVAGRNLYDAVFGFVPKAEERHQVTQIVDHLKTTLRTEQIIQIARLKQMEDIWPWALMYDSLIDPKLVKTLCVAYRGKDGPLPYTEGAKNCAHTKRDKTVVCPYNFWGFKHIIEQPTQPGGETAFSDLTLEIKIQTEPVLQMLLENGLGESEAQHVTDMKALKFRPVNSLHEFTAGLDPDSEPLPPEPHVVYFFCHGKYDAQNSPYLQIGANESLLPSELDELDFRWANSHGLVFINGCHTAELLPKDLASIMKPFVEAYASGIIGTEISVTTALAREFGKKFFDRFLADNNDKQDNRIGQIIKDLRLDLLMKYNPLGLVYTPYCSADLHVAR